MRRLFTIALICAAVFARNAQSQKPPSTPEEVARAFFEAAASNRWSEAAGYLDLEAFERYRRQMVESVRHPYAGPPMTAAQLMKQDPDMPLAVAEYQLRQVEKVRRDSSRWLRYEFADVASVNDLAGLTTLDAASRWIEAQDLGYKMREAAKLSVVRCNKPPRVPSIPELKSEPNRIIGVIVHDSVAYVLHQSREMQSMASARDSAHVSGEATLGVGAAPAGVSEWGTSPPSIMQLHLSGNRWVILGAQGLLDGVIMVSTECVEEHGVKK